MSEVPDIPSAEPSSDLLAQFEEMNSGSARTGVYLSADNLQRASRAVQLRVAEAKHGRRAIPIGEGLLIAKSAVIASNAVKALSTGVSAQKVIGGATGAGNGKRLDQTLVVQGRTPRGAVVSEGMISPGEATAKLASVKAAGHLPVVTTPDAALQRREQMLSQEHQLSPAVLIAALRGNRNV